MPTLANTNRVALAYIPEATFGTTPATGTPKNLRFTGESLNYDLTIEASKEIRADRQTPGGHTLDANANGGINFEFSFGEYDPLFQSVLQNTFNTGMGGSGQSTSFVADFAATTITNTGVALTGSSAFTNLDKGQWFILEAAGHANDQIMARVSVTTAPTASVITVDSPTLTVGTGVTGVRIRSMRISNGTTQMSFSVERQVQDVAQYQTYKGMNVQKLNLKFAAAALVTGSIDFLGARLVRASSTGLPTSPVPTPPATSPSASQTNEPFDGASGGFSAIWEGGANLTTMSIKSVDLTIENNLRPQVALGTLGPVAMGTGSVKISGQMEVYFSVGTLLDKFLASTYSSLTVLLRKALRDTPNDYSGYAFVMPRIKYTDHNITAGSKDGDLMATVDFEAFADDANATAALRKSIFIDRMGTALTTTF